MSTTTTSPTTIRGLKSFFSFALGLAFYPIPGLTSSDTDGTLFIAPLAYLVATLITAVYFSQIWLFTMSAFGVVWLDTQMAWRAKQIGKTQMEHYIAEQAQSAPTPPNKGTVEEPTVEAPPMDKVPEKPVQIEEVTAHLKGSNMKDMSAFITTTTLCVLPAQVLETHFTPEAAERLQGEIESSIVMQHQQQQQQQQQFINRPSSRHEVLQTVLEEEEIASSGDKHFTLMSDMEAVHRELARVLTARNQSRQESDEDQYATSPSVDTDLQSRGPPPEIPPRPRAPLSPMIAEEAPALPEIEDEDLNIFSMEELEEPVSSSSSVKSFGDFVEAPPSGTGVGQDFSRPSTSQGKKEVPHFPIIDDVLSEYEASLHSVDRDRRIEYLDDHEGLTSGDESRNGFSDESICDSPATSVSSTNEDDIDAQSLDAGKESQQVDSGLVMEMGSKELSVHQKNSESVSSNTLPKRPVYIRGSSSRSSTARRAPKKNNGWKRVPKKARLSPGEKKRFVSRAFW